MIYTDRLGPSTVTVRVGITGRPVYVNLDQPRLCIENDILKAVGRDHFPAAVAAVLSAPAHGPNHYHGD